MWARLRKCDCRRAFAIGSETKKTCGSIGFEGGVVRLSLAGCAVWPSKGVMEPKLSDAEREKSGKKKLSCHCQHFFFVVNQYVY